MGFTLIKLFQLFTVKICVGMSVYIISVYGTKVISQMTIMTSPTQPYSIDVFLMEKNWFNLSHIFQERILDVKWGIPVVDWESEVWKGIQMKIRNCGTWEMQKMWSVAGCDNYRTSNSPWKDQLWKWEIWFEVDCGDKVESKWRWRIEEPANQDEVTQCSNLCVELYGSESWTWTK